MPWKPLPAVAFAICVYPFRATEPDDLPLQVGDHIYIIEQGGNTNEWYRGYLVAPPSLLAGLSGDHGQQLEHRVFSGIFPRNCVEVREFVGESRVNGQVHVPDAPQDVEDVLEARRKSQTLARRLSRRLSRKKSTREFTRKPLSILASEEPMPRDPNAPRPSAPVPLLRVGDETVASADEPLVDEIASCLREWHDARLHEILLARGYQQLTRVQDLIKRVDSNRSQLMHDVLTMKELAELREDTVWDLVAGNKMLNDDIIVRSPTEKGRILTANDSVIEMTRLQANMSILDRPPNITSDKNMLYHLLVDLRTLIWDADQPATLQVFLCAKDFNGKPRPISETFAISIPLVDPSLLPPEELSKTLFANLSGPDATVGGGSSSLYLVFKLLKDEPVKSLVFGQGLAHSGSVSNTTSSRTSSFRGRHSVFGGGSKKKDIAHSRNTSELTERPETAQSEHSQSDGRFSTSHSRNRPAEVKYARRSVGIGAVDVSALARRQASIESSVTLWNPSSADDASKDADDWIEVIRELGSSASEGYSRVNLVKRFDIYVKAFAAPDLDALVRNTPTLLHDVLVTPKIGFSGVPRQKRNDIYLNLVEPRLLRNATLAHSKFGTLPLNQRSQTSLSNLQITLEVRQMNGERIDDCIFTSSNHHGHTAWRTTAVERGEAWHQTIKLVIPPDMVEGSHVVMSIADTPNFPFALAWLPLWEFDAFVRDGDHQLALYVYDEYSSSIIGGRGAYLALPPWHDRSDPDQVNAATISLNTILCSTEHSQDPNLAGLLHWRQFHGEKLIEHLERFALVPEIEIVKLLSDVFGALFEILDEYGNDKNYEDLIFSNFVVVLSIARDKRFDLNDIVDRYAKTRHDWPHASRSLIDAYHRLVSKPMDADSSRKLRQTLKVGDQVLRLIVEAAKPTLNREVFDEDGQVIRQQSTLARDLQKLFVTIMALLRNPLPVLLGTQTLVIQNFHSWLPELVPVMAPTEIFEIATDLMDACSHAQGKTIFHRIILILNYSRLDVFKSPDIRSILVANTFRWLAPYWGDAVEVTEQWHTQVRLCCSVLATQMDELNEGGCQHVPKLAESFLTLEKAKRTPKRTFSMLFPSSYPFPSKPTDQDVDVDEAMLELSSLLAAALNTSRRLYFDASEVDIPSVLLQALKVEQSVLSCKAFPRSWLSLLVCHHRCAVTALERISELLIESLPDIYAPDASEAFEFDTAIWRTFFETLFAALSSPSLAMETFPEQKRRAIWKIAGDVRELGANLLKRTWEAIGWETDADSRRIHGFARMGGYQVQFVPELVAPVVELCLSVHASLRGVAIQVLRTMMISAWELDQDLSIIQTAMIDCLDKLCSNKSVTESVLQKTFVPEMLVQFASLQNTVEDSLYNAVVDMFKKIENLLGMLASVHQGDGINDASRLVDTLRLMEFLKDIQSEEAFVRYVHQLAAMEIASGSFTEAALALRMHADRYEWDPSTHLGPLTEPKMPAQTMFERKEALYFQMCQQFEKGRSWQRALVAYRELATQYEFNTFDFAKLARAQRAIASVHEKIAKGDRNHPRYFRVVHKGLGFPPSLRDKEFIYEGLPNDRLANFEDRLQQLYPAATILRAGTEPEVEGQFLHVYAVSPNKDLRHVVYQRTKVSQAAREYTLMSNPQAFTTTTRQAAQDVPITEQTVEKVIYTTAEAFPTISRRTEVVHVQTVTLSPIEAAVERTTRKTQELISLEKRISSHEDDSALARLWEELAFSVDPHSDSSVSRYHNLLPASEVGDNGSAEVDPSLFELESDTPINPMQAALKVALLDHTLAIRRCLGLYSKPIHLATRAELVARFEATFERELQILFPHTNGVVDFASRHSSEVELEQVLSEEPQLPNGGTTAADQSAPESRGRRRSIPFIKRASSRQGRTNGSTDDGESSRPGSRGRGRDRSLSRRLSFFRRSANLDPLDSQINNSTAAASLKKRLSFLNTTG